MRMRRRVFAAFLGTVLCIAGVTGCTAGKVNAEAVISTKEYDMNSAMPYMNQTISPYAYIKIPALHGDTSVCARGCSVVSYSMIEGYYRGISDADTGAKASLVKNVAGKIRSSDIDRGDNIMISVYGNLAARYGRAAETVDVRWNDSARKPASKNGIHYLTERQKLTLIEALGMGYPVGNPTHGRFSLVGGGHYMVWSGIDTNGNIYIHNANGKYSGQSFPIDDLDALSNGSCTIVYPSDKAVMTKDFDTIFDYEYYVFNNPKIRTAFGGGSVGDKIRAAAHFFTTGIKEGLQASPYFNIDDYMKQNPDVAQYYHNDRAMCFRHYCYQGFGEGRSAIGTENATIFDPVFYADHYPDVKKLCGTNAVKLMQHFRMKGMNSLLQGCEEFNPDTYIQNYSELRKLYRDSWVSYYLHYMKWGRNAGWTGRGKGRFVPVTVYNGIDYKDVYDYQYYCRNNKDIASRYNWRDDYGILEHFVKYGMKEGRTGSPDFVLDIYKEKNPSLVKEYGTENEGYYMHYIWWGKKAGWQASA